MRYSRPIRLMRNCDTPLISISPVSRDSGTHAPSSVTSCPRQQPIKKRTELTRVTTIYRGFAHPPLPMFLPEDRTLYSSPPSYRPVLATGQERMFFSCSHTRRKC